MKTGGHKKTIIVSHLKTPLSTTTAKKNTEDQSLRIFSCARCLKQVQICSHCDRGQIYCSRECSHRQRRENNRRAARRYQNSPKGRRNHADRQNRYRNRKKKVTHQGSHPPSEKVIICQLIKLLWFFIDDLHKNHTECSQSTVKDEDNCCDFCGHTLSGFTRYYFLGSKEVPD